MRTELEKQYQIDILAEQAGGYFSFPSGQELVYTDLLFSVCEQLGIRYYSAAPRERCLVEKATLATWLRQNEQQS